MNPEKDNEKLEEMVRVLVEKISVVLSESPDIKEALRQIEQEGYRVDLVLASVTRILKKEAPDIPADAQISFGLNQFDRAFLQAIRVRPNSE